MRHERAIGGLLQLARASHDASRLVGDFLLLASAWKLQSYFNAVTTDLSELERLSPIRARKSRSNVLN
jgi:hypothetical protein